MQAVSMCVLGSNVLKIPIICNQGLIKSKQTNSGQRIVAALSSIHIL